jgi:colanic acid/amylovoran biosynthesis glycosyltransferase
VRVLFCLTSFPAPSQTFVESQITGLLDRGFDVRILSLQPGKEAPRHEDTLRYDLAGRTSYVPRGRKRALLELPKLARPVLASPPSFERLVGGARRLSALGPKEAFRVLRRATALLAQWPFDAMVCHFGPVGVDVQRLRDVGVTTAPMLTFFHGYDVSRTIDERGPGYYAGLFERCELLLPISDYWRRKLVGLGAPAERTLVHRMGVDCKKIEFRERHLLAGETVQLLSIARLTEKKGIEYALRALARVRDTLKFEYHVLGDGELKASLDRLIDELELRSRVTLHGWKTQGEVAAVLARSHVLLQPSVTASDGDQEGIPVALMEGLAAGMPVVSTEHTGIPELVEHGRSGFLVPERDVPALANRVQELLEAPESWPAFGRAGRSMVERQFDVDVLNDQLATRLELAVAARQSSKHSR